MGSKHKKKQRKPTGLFPPTTTPFMGDLPIRIQRRYSCVNKVLMIRDTDRIQTNHQFTSACTRCQPYRKAIPSEMVKATRHFHLSR
jgi:hypothetical protein